MDDEHEALWALVQALRAAPDDRLADALDAFARQAREHFGAEDAWMAETDFPARSCHADEHAAVLATVRGVQRRVAGGESAVARRLADELQSWLPAHVQHLDSALALWLCRARFGGQPVVLRRRPDPDDARPGALTV